MLVINLLYPKLKHSDKLKDPKMKVKMYSVYILYKNGKAVYIGCSKNVKRRLYKHRENKDFDGHIILKRYKTKDLALNAENSLISFLTLFGDGNWYNAEQILLSHQRDFYLRSI